MAERKELDYSIDCEPNEDLGGDPFTEANERIIIYFTSTGLYSFCLKISEIKGIRDSTSTFLWIEDRSRRFLATDRRLFTLPHIGVLVDSSFVNGIRNGDEIFYVYHHYDSQVGSEQYGSNHEIKPIYSAFPVPKTLFLSKTLSQLREMLNPLIGPVKQPNILLELQQALPPLVEEKKDRDEEKEIYHTTLKEFVLLIDIIYERDEDRIDHLLSDPNFFRTKFRNVQFSTSCKHMCVLLLRMCLRDDSETLQYLMFKNLLHSWSFRIIRGDLGELEDLRNETDNVQIHTLLDPLILRARRREEVDQRREILNEPILAEDEQRIALLIGANYRDFVAFRNSLDDNENENMRKFREYMRDVIGGEIIPTHQGILILERAVLLEQLDFVNLIIPVIELTPFEDRMADLGGGEEEQVALHNLKITALFLEDERPFDENRKNIYMALNEFDESYESSFLQDCIEHDGVEQLRFIIQLYNFNVDDINEAVENIGIEEVSDVVKELFVELFGENWNE